MTVVGSERVESSVHPDVVELVEELGLRHEIIDGALVVNPPASPPHERVVNRLSFALMAALPEGLEVFTGLGFYYDPTHPPSYLLADVCVVRTEDVDDKGTRTAPLLVVEVLSPSTRRRDAAEKRDIYAESGVPSYWVVDPKALVLTVQELVDGRYVETARAQGADELTVERPFPVTVRIS